jgi:hypothetical protein
MFETDKELSTSLKAQRSVMPSCHRKDKFVRLKDPGL